MGSVTVFNSARMQEIEDGTVVAGFVDVDGHLLLEKHDGGQIDAGYVVGPAGTTSFNGLTDIPASLSPLAQGAFVPTDDATTYPLGITTFLANPLAGWPDATRYWVITTIRSYISTTAGGTFQLATCYQSGNDGVYYRQWLYAAVSPSWGSWTRLRNTDDSVLSSLLSGVISDANIRATIRASNTASGTNLNTLVENGWTAVSAPVNGPPGVTSGWVYVQTQRLDSANFIQLAFYRDGSTDGVVFRRQILNSVFGAWKKISDGPYADANGVAYAPSGGANVPPLWYSSTFTITLPSGKFTVPPDVIVGAAGLGVLYASVIGTPTTTSFQATVVRLNAALAASSHQLVWHAIQRTSTSAEG